jgi:hypothetical protein
VTRLALLTQLLLLPALALAGPAPSRAVVAASPAVAEASPRITLKFHGPLRDAAERIATEGKLNVVVRGELDEDAELFFQNVPADEALQTLAQAYGLSLEKHGTIYTLRPRGSEGSPPRMIAPLPPIPPTPPTPPTPPSLGSHHGKADSAEEDGDDSDKDDNDDEDADASAAHTQWADKMAQLKDLKDLKDLKGLLRFHKSGGGSDKQTVGTGNVVVEEEEEVDDAIAYGGSLVVKGRVRGDATAFGGNVHLGPHAVVHGDAVAFGGTVEREPGAKVHGETLSFGGSNGGVLGKHPLSAKNLEKHSHSALPGLLAQFAVYFALGFVFLMFAPKPMKQIESELRRDPLRCGLTGVLGGAAILGLTVLLTITLVGIPFAVVLVLAAAVGLAMGFSALASEVGTRLPVLRANRKTQAAVLALGILVFLVVELIPILGPLVLFCAGCFALGATIRTRFGTRPREFPEAI